MSDWPSDPRLAEIARSIASTRWAAEIWDSEWHLAWVSEETKAILGVGPEEDVGIGQHILEARYTEPWRTTVTDATRAKMLQTQAAIIAHDMEGGPDEVARIYNKVTGLQVPAIHPNEHPPPMWTGTIELTHAGMPTIDARWLAHRLHTDEGEFLGTVYVYGAMLPARLLAFVTRGSEAMYRRMAELVDPGRRQSAVLFADLQASGALSRRLSSAAYFKLIRALNTAMDAVIIRGRGIVGKHAGDGVSAYFLNDEFESPSEAAATAIEAAHELRRAAYETADQIGRETGLFTAADCPLNVGVHWGSTLYMGQVVTGGRLEVTALGDEVNECARIQQTAREGAVLASKALIERLVDDDATRVGIDPQAVVYCTLAELPGADEKAIRDAGTLSVTELFADERLEQAA